MSDLSWRYSAPRCMHTICRSLEDVQTPAGAMHSTPTKPTLKDEHCSRDKGPRVDDHGDSDEFLEGTLRVDFWNR